MASVGPLKLNRYPFGTFILGHLVGAVVFVLLTYGFFMARQKKQTKADEEA